MKNDWLTKQIEKSIEKKKQDAKSATRAKRARENGSKGGRPRMEKQPRNKVVVVRLTAEELLQVKVNAQKHEMTTANFIRKVSRQEHIATEAEREAVHILSQYRSDLIRAGNMYAHHAGWREVKDVLIKVAEDIKNWIQNDRKR
jgi:predicted DNA binding CopG/RHH family protein